MQQTLRSVHYWYNWPKSSSVNSIVNILHAPPCRLHALNQMNLQLKDFFSPCSLKEKIYVSARKGVHKC